MICSLLHPGLLLIFSGLLIPFIKGAIRTPFILFIPCLALIITWNTVLGSTCSTEYLGYELILVNLDALSRLFITVFAITVFTGGLFCCKQGSSTELAAAFIYAGGAMSVVLASDLISLFFFWELMALASTLILWSSRTPASGRASMRFIYRYAGQLTGNDTHIMRFFVKCRGTTFVRVVG